MRHDGQVLAFIEVFMPKPLNRHRIVWRTPQMGSRITDFVVGRATADVGANTAT